MDLDASENIKATINKIVGRIEKRGITPLIGFEWEFQLLDASGKPVLFSTDIADLINNPSVEQAGEEAGLGTIEITTKPLPPVKAAEALIAIQEKMVRWAQKNGYHISLGPLVPKVGENWDSPDTSSVLGTGLHVNASLVDVKNPSKSTSVLYVDCSTQGNDDVAANTDPRTANIIHGILKVNEETPLWSFHGNMSLLRLMCDETTPLRYSSSVQKRQAGIALRSNIEDEIEAAEFSEFSAKCDSVSGVPGAEAQYQEAVKELQRLEAEKKRRMGSKSPDFPARTEERFPESGTDPFVAAFRTVLGQYHGLENHVFNKNTPVASINLDDIPNSYQKLQAAHLPSGGVISSYVGDLYDEATLREIDERGKNPPIADIESKKFKPVFASTKTTMLGATLTRAALASIRWGEGIHQESQTI